MLQSDRAFVVDHHSNALLPAGPLQYRIVAVRLNPDDCLRQDRRAIAHKMAPRRNGQSQLFYLLIEIFTCVTSHLCLPCGCLCALLLILCPEYGAPATRRSIPLSARETSCNAS